MQYRRFGHTDLHVSEIGFGAWAIGGAAEVGGVPIGWGNADDQTSKEAITAALHAGINFFDTADFYGLGHSEELLGKVLKGQKETVIATKVGQRNVDDSIVVDYSKAYLLQACEKSLQRLQRDCIDYYQLHNARLPHLQQGECIEAMEQLKQEGKIRYWGLSLNTFHPSPEADFLLERDLGDGFQLVLNIINQRAMEVVQTAAAKEYGIIARMPLQFGLLTGKFSNASQFSANDHRNFRFSPEILQQSLQFLEDKVWPLCDKEGLSKTGLALDYLLSFPEVNTVIPGIRTAEQVQQNTSELKPLTAPAKRLLQSLAKDWEPVVQLMEQQG
jgi:aryl-alcohol dehydrogenase-like predicted oxidoreductase